MRISAEWRQHLADVAAQEKEAAKTRRFGVYRHATWRSSDCTVVETPISEGGGYVVREISGAVPYGRMTPVAVYKLRSAAQKRADKLNA
jgi:hypothetical protein